MRDHLDFVGSNMGIRDCRLVDLHEYRDERGNLTVVEGNRHIPFDIQRVYYLYDVSDGAVRRSPRPQGVAADHHPDFGELRCDPRRWTREETISPFPSESRSLCLPHGLEGDPHLSDHSVCMVLASRHYEPSDYIHEYDEFYTQPSGGNVENSLPGPEGAILELKEEMDAAYRRVMGSGWFVLGQEVESFEEEFAG